MTNVLRFKTLKDYAEWLTDVVNCKQPELDHIEIKECHDGSIEATLFFAPVE